MKTGENKPTGLILRKEFTSPGERGRGGGGGGTVRSCNINQNLFVIAEKVFQYFIPIVMPVKKMHFVV